VSFKFVGACFCNERLEVFSIGSFSENASRLFSFPPEKVGDDRPESKAFTAHGRLLGRLSGSWSGERVCVCVSFLHICLIVAPNPCHLVSVTPIINSFLSSKPETSACHFSVSFSGWARERERRGAAPRRGSSPSAGALHTHACGRPSSSHTPHTKNYTFITADCSSC
jgi:hypothetical protein